MRRGECQRIFRIVAIFFRKRTSTTLVRATILRYLLFLRKEDPGDVYKYVNIALSVMVLIVNLLPSLLDLQSLAIEWPLPDYTTSVTQLTFVVRIRCTKTRRKALGSVVKRLFYFLTVFESHL